MRPEILAPAGSHDSLRAALRAGADAVYFGVEHHNARARASNFTVLGLPDLLREIHDRGAKGYLALNTLVFDHELDDLAKILDRAEEAGVDAIIVQDLGLAAMARARVPSLPLHASTQMTCTDADSVALAAELGARRVVLARELSVREIAAIRRAANVDLEVFVHGALCISYSGQCLTSEAIGGRSANRGACAQACRLPYTIVVDGERRADPQHPYLLSPQDLESSRLVPELIAAGVTAFKIEGRLKGPDYVAATIRLYREAIRRAQDEELDREANLRDLRTVALQTYSRGSGHGFLDGLDHQRLVEGHTCAHRGLSLGPLLDARPHRGQGRDLLLRPAHDLRRGDGLLLVATDDARDVGGFIWTMESLDGRDLEEVAAGDDVWVWLGPDKVVPGPATRWVAHRSGSPSLLRREARREAYRRPLRLEVSGKLGEHLTVDAWDDHGQHVRVASESTLVIAHGAGLSAAMLEAKLGRLGESPFSLDALVCHLDEGLMLPASELNHLRRTLVRQLLDRRLVRPSISIPPPRVVERSPGAPSGLWVLARNENQARAALEAGADGVYLDFLELTGTGHAIRALRASFARPIGVCPPRIRKPSEDKIERYLERLEPDYVLVRTLGLLRNLFVGPRFIGDFSLNVANARTAEELLARGLDAITPAHDLDAKQLRALAGQPALAPWLEVVVHHPTPFFHMEHCVFAALLSSGRDHLSCGRPCERHTVELEDRTGARHALEADVGCRNTLFRGESQSAAQDLPLLREGGVRRFRIECLREDPTQVRALVSIYRAILENNAPASAARRELARHGLSTVRGSLQVL